jgi:hypothetical protein
MALHADCDLIWHIKGARFRFDDPVAYGAWTDEKKVYFSFNPTFSDDKGAAVFWDAKTAAGYFEITEDRGTLSIALGEDGPVITAWVKVRAELVEGVDGDALSAWSSEQGGWATAIIDLGQYEAELHWDDGGDWRLPSDA